MKKIKEFVRKYADFTKAGFICFSIVLICFILCVLSVIFHPDVITWYCFVFTLCMLVIVYFIARIK